jgi:hypothetical protein
LPQHPLRLWRRWHQLLLWNLLILLDPVGQLPLEPQS